MYIPSAFAITDPDEVEAVLRASRLGCLVTHDAEGLFATHMPFLYDPERRVFTGHVARANPHWRRAGEGEALIIFEGPDAYVSPSAYPSKAEHGRVVPTWNYEAAHVYGRLTWRDDVDWLIAHVGGLSDREEAHRPAPWSIDDAPADFIRGLARGVVGLELVIERVEVKRKLSQNRPEADRRGVIDALAASDDARDREMAHAMES